MLALFRRFFENRRIKKQGFTTEQWEAAISDWHVMHRYRGTQRDALREMSFRFLARKELVSGSNFQFSDAMSLKLATMACVPILNLGLDWYDHWYSVILYEGDFIPNRDYRSADGVVHTSTSVHSGEAWWRGPVILSWSAICNSGPTANHGLASNVVIHEVAHKLDMLRDGANGAPPMHPDMQAKEWHNIFSNAWERLNKESISNQVLPLDEYALTNPAEFFAVCSENFFEAPERLQANLPNVYRLLCQFYRQQPLG